MKQHAVTGIDAGLHAMRAIYKIFKVNIGNTKRKTYQIYCTSVFSIYRPLAVHNYKKRYKAHTISIIIHKALNLLKLDNKKLGSLDILKPSFSDFRGMGTIPYSPISYTAMQCNYPTINNIFGKRICNF